MSIAPGDLARRLVFVVLVSALLVASCGPGKVSYSNTPEGITRKLFDSLQENDANKYLDSIVPADRSKPGYFFYRQLVQGIFGATGLGSVEAAKLKISFTNLVINVISNDGAIAQEQVTGKLRDLNLALEQDFATPLTVVDTGGTWLVSVSGVASQDATPVPAAAATGVVGFAPTAVPLAQQFKIFLQHVLVGESAFKYVTDYNGNNWNPSNNPKDGWQLVAFDLILENVGPAPVNSPRYLSGSLVDSGGYTRPFQIDAGPAFLPPHVRYRNVGYASIPLNQSPVSIDVGFSNGLVAGQPIFHLDLSKPDDGLAVPFDSVPAGYPAAQDGAMQFTQPGAYRLKYSDFQFVQNPYEPQAVSLEATFQLENLGGNDLTLGQLGDFIVGFDNHGNYYQATVADVGRESVPPGVTKELKGILVFVMGRPNVDFNTIWIFMFHAQGAPIAQMQLSPTAVPAASSTSALLANATVNPTNPPTGVPIDTSTPNVINSPTPLPAPTKVSCPSVSGAFAATWSEIQSSIGCSRGQAVVGLVVEEAFQQGKMMWRQPVDTAQALVLFGNGVWKLYQHAPFVDGSPDYPCADANTPAQSPPTPRRGFGTMWCDIPAIRNGLGNATDAERGFSGAMQVFDDGFMIQTDYGANFVFYSNGVWERR